jgi:membrane protein implicated in regulation of membrane protease activity
VTELDPTTVRLALTGLVAAVFVAVGVCGQRLRPPDEAWGLSFLVAGLGCAMIWLPASWRTPVITLLVTALFLLAAGFWAGAIMGGICLALSLFAVPGGGTVFVLGVLVLVAIVVVVMSARRIRRMARARALEPGRVPVGDVELGGRVAPLRTISPPGVEQPCVAWCANPWDRRPQSTELFAIHAAQGVALVDPAGAELDLKQHTRKLTEDEARALLELRDGEPPPKDKSGPGALCWIEEGTEAYVVGVPSWELVPGGQGDYRGAPLLPVFRSREGAKVYVADRPEWEVRRESLFALISFALWGPEWIAIALAQALRLA